MTSICTAPNYDAIQGPSLFLAGGITGCEDWQSEAIKLILASNKRCGTIFNPRRKLFDINDPTAAEKQIRWEYEMLMKARTILFWFPAGQLQPIALFELGRWSSRPLGKTIFVGCDPTYPRRQDIEIQMQLARPEMTIYYDLAELCAACLKG